MPPRSSTLPKKSNFSNSLLSPVSLVSLPPSRPTCAFDALLSRTASDAPWEYLDVFHCLTDRLCHAIMQGMMTTTTTTQIATSLGLSEHELFQQALVSFLIEKKRQVLQLKLEILARYSVESTASLEAKIAEGGVAEHPAWEDLIVVENLSIRLEELNTYVANLQDAQPDRSA